MRKITLYGKPNCPLCDQTRYHLKRLLPQYGGAAEWQVEEVNIIEDPDLYRKYRYVIPVVEVEGIGPLPAPASLDPVMLKRMITTPPGDYAMSSEAATLLQAGQMEAETTSMQNALRSGKPAQSVEEEQRHELYEELVNTIDAPLEALAGTIQAHEVAQEREPGAGSREPETGEARVAPIEGGPVAPANPYAGPYPGYPPVPVGDRGPLGFLDRPASGFGRRWVAIVNTVVGIFVGLPWLAPVFAALGWWGPADAIYTVYAFFCHQLPERAGFIFGYQVADCFRDTALYLSIFLTGLLYSYARRHPGRFTWITKALDWRIFLLAMLPIAVDGMTHLLGFRETNDWFDAITGGVFDGFSVGDAVGTLNWWLRIISGALFGFALVWLIYPHVDNSIRGSDNPYLRTYYAPAKPTRV